MPNANKVSDKYASLRARKVAKIDRENQATFHYSLDQNEMRLDPDAPDMLFDLYSHERLDRREEFDEEDEE